MSANGVQTSSSTGGFWKIHHLAIGVALLLLVLFVVRSCGGDSSDEKVESKDEAVPRQAIVVEIPATQWQGARSSTAPQGYAPAYSAQQSPRQPVYGYPAQQQPGVQPQPAYQADPGNPWAVRPTPPSYGSNYGSGAQPSTRHTQGWGQRQREQSGYFQQPGGIQFRPLDGQASARSESHTASPAPAVPGTVAPYDRLSGSSYGENSAGPGAAWPYAGGYPGYYGATPYGGVPGPYPPMAPGTLYPRGLYPGGW